MMAILRILSIGENLSRAGEPRTLRETAVESNFGANRTHRFSHQIIASSAVARSKRLTSDFIERRRKNQHSSFCLQSIPFLNSEFFLLNSCSNLHSSAYENSSRWYSRRNRHVHLDLNRAHGITSGRSRSRRNSK